MKTLRIMTAIGIAVALMVLAVPTAQGQVYEKTINYRNIVLHDAANPELWYDAYGPDVIKFEETFGPGSYLDSTGFMRSLTNAEFSSGDTVLTNFKTYANPETYTDSSFSVKDSVGGLLQISCRLPRTTNRSGGSIQARQAIFKLDTAGVKHPLYFGIRFRMPDSLARYQMFAGLASAADTTTYDTTVIGAGFFKRASALNAVHIDTFETVIKSAGTTKTHDLITADSLDQNRWEKCEMFFTGDSINFYHNGVLVKQRGSNIPTTTMLTPTVDIRNISSAASFGTASGPKLIEIDWIRCIQINTE